MPWLRVGLEGLVIVVSILLAFGVDASWDERQASGAEAELVAAIAQDLTRSRESMQRALATHDGRRAAFVAFLGSGAAELSSLSADSARYLVGQIYSTTTLNLSDGLIRRVELSELSSPELRSALGAWSDIAADQLEGVASQLDLARDLYFAELRAYPDLADQIGPDRRPGTPTISFDTDSAEILVALRSSRDFIDQRVVLQIFEDIDYLKIQALVAQTDRVLELTGS